MEKEIAETNTSSITNQQLKNYIQRDLKRQRSWSYISHYYDSDCDIITCRLCEEQASIHNCSTVGLLKHLENVHGLKKGDVFVKYISSLPMELLPRKRGRPSKQPESSHSLERILSCFKQNDAGPWLCRKCDFTCPTANHFEMFHHLTTVHWNGILTTSYNNSSNTTKDSNTSSADNTDSGVFGNSSEDDFHDESQTFNNIHNLPGPSSTENNSDPTIERACISNTRKTESQDDNTADANDYLKRYNMNNLLPIVLVKRCSSNVQQALQDLKHELLNKSRYILDPIDSDHRTLDHWYSGQTSETASKTPKLRVAKRKSAGVSSAVDTRFENLDLPEPAIQAPLQNERAFDTQSNWNNDEQISINYTYIKSTRAGQKQNVGVITMNRPRTLNALCKRFVDEINDAVSKFNSDDTVGAIVITGNETAFAAGADISEMQNYTHTQAIKNNLLISWNSIYEASKPVIAAVNGYALGAGCELALMCDIIYAGTKASFGQPEIIFGTIPGAGGIQRLTRAVGKSKAMEMVLTGNQMSAVEAEQSGLASKIFPPEKLLSEAIKLGETISNHSLLIVSMAKEAVDSAYETSLQEGLRLEMEIFCGTLTTADQAEGMAAFIERREPKYKNE